MELELIASHKKPRLNDYIPFLVLASLLILPITQAFHFNASLTQLTHNELSAQIEPINNNLSILTNQPDKSNPFLQVTHARQNIENTEEFKLEKRELPPAIGIPPSPNIDHPPICILSDADFATQGWPGSGTVVDPYRIANLNINASGTLSDCIEIRNTQLHFIIANCNLFEAPLNSGISLHNTVNVTLTTNFCFQVHTGIQIIGCNAVSIHYNFFSNIYYGPGASHKGTGIELQRCNHCDIDNNEFLNLNWGIVLTESTEVVISENEFEDNSCGVLADFSYSSIITKNLCEANQIGITLVFGSKNVISENTCFLNTNGIDAYYARASILRNNNCTRNFERGIYLQGGGNNSLEDNHCYFSKYGIYFQSENKTTSIGNSLSHNRYGLYLDDESSFNQVLHNDFMDSFLAHAWNDGRDNVFAGNYWSDYVGWDLNFDGYGELPYLVPGQSEARDYSPRGFTIMLTLQMWAMILFTCISLLATMILGRHLSILAKGEES
ncbi:MAG: NosD domain-containing protein [Candidatus Hermodarchaeota archaeon]|nr:NosD domain-containing protein [Candidatus Hermodarchaeota archaeon]